VTATRVVWEGVAAVCARRERRAWRAWSAAVQLGPRSLEEARTWAAFQRASARTARACARAGRAR
jgi:hypothetical protein